MCSTASVTGARYGVAGTVYRVGTGDGYGTGWVQGRGNTGTQHAARKEGISQRSGPVGSCREPEWWGYGRVRPSYPDHPLQAPCAFRGPLRCLGTSPRAEAASGTIRTRLRSIFSKYSMNHGVSPKSV